MSRVITQTAFNQLKQHEGLRLTAYLCPGDVWTIGYGHTRTAKPNMVITEEEAESLLRADVSYFERGVQKLLKRDATDNQFSAFVSLAFNIGLGNFADSTALRRFNAGDIAGAAEAITWWNKANGKVLKGLVKRREQERNMFLSNIEEDIFVEDNEYTPGQVEGGKPASMAKDPAVIGAGGSVVLSVFKEVSETITGVPIPSEYLLVVIVTLVLVTLFMRWRKQRAGAVH